MKKVFTILAIGMLMQFQSFGHAWYIHRKWCGGIFHYKYQAFAEIDAYAKTTYSTGYDSQGRYMGTSPIVIPYSECYHYDKGCSRPRVADCSISDYIFDYIYSGPYLQINEPYYFSGYAECSYQIGYIYFAHSATGRAIVGRDMPIGSYKVVDSTKFAKLDTTGFSYGKVVATTIDATDSGQLTIEDLNGELTIGTGTDYYSKFKVVIIKERDDASDEELEKDDSLIRIGIFPNMVDSGEIMVSKGSITKGGFFNNLSDSQVTVINSNDSFGVNLHNINLSLNIGIQPLQEHEHLTIIGITDGGLDIHSAVIAQSGQRPARPTRMEHLEDERSHPISIYPNPTSNAISVIIYSEKDNSNISFEAFDFLGRNLGEIYSGKLNAGENIINHIDVSTLPKGIVILHIRKGNEIIYKKLSIK